MSLSLATWCSGIGAPECAVLGEAGWHHHSVAEIEPFPAAVLGARFGAGAPEVMPDPDDLDHLPDPDEVGLDAEEAERRRVARQDVADGRRAARRTVAAHPWPAVPAVPNLGDLTAPDFAARLLRHGIPDVIVAGTPCQAFSIAGRREGLADARGNLTLTALNHLEAVSAAARSAGRAEPIFLWENVPGVLSDATNAFGCLLAGLVGHDSPLLPPGRGGGDGGETRVWSLDPRDVPRGVSSMLNTSAWPNDGRACSLSRVLWRGPIPPRYFLSPKACNGILRRASARGKELPPALASALRAAASLPH